MGVCAGKGGEEVRKRGVRGVESRYNCRSFKMTPETFESGEW